MRIAARLAYKDLQSAAKAAHLHGVGSDAEAESMKESTEKKELPQTTLHLNQTPIVGASQDG